MTRTCECGAMVDDTFGDPLDYTRWRITTDGTGNALTWWCPTCWATRLQSVTDPAELDLLPPESQ